MHFEAGGGSWSLITDKMTVSGVHSTVILRIKLSNSHCQALPEERAASLPPAS